MPRPFPSLFVVKGDSMNPTLQHGDLILVAGNRRGCDGYRRGAVVVARIPTPGAADGSNVSVKRVVGLPGEYVRVEKDGAVWVDDRLLYEPYLKPATAAAPYVNRSWLCGEDEYILMGDNRADSWDSRAIGPVPVSKIIGRMRLNLPTHLFAGRRSGDDDRPIPGNDS